MVNKKLINDAEISMMHETSNVSKYFVFIIMIVQKYFLSFMFSFIKIKNIPF